MPWGDNKTLRTLLSTSHVALATLCLAVLSFGVYFLVKDYLQTSGVRKMYVSAMRAVRPGKGMRRRERQAPLRYRGDLTQDAQVLVDDIASTGNTVAATCRALAAHRPASIRVMVTHALFAAGALERMLAAGADEVVSCDSIRHPSNRISLADSLARALRDLR